MDENNNSFDNINNSNEFQNNDKLIYGSDLNENMMSPEDYKKEAKAAYSKIGLGAAAFFAIWNILVIIITLVMFIVNDKNGVSYSSVIIINLVVEVLIAAPVFYMIVRNQPVKKLEKKNTSFKEFFTFICIMYFFSIVGSLIASAINGMLAGSFGVTSDSSITELFDNSFVLAALYSAIAAPIVEELVFRKLIIDRLNKYGAKMAVIMSGFLFGLAHGNIEQFFYTFFIGLLLGYVYINTGKIKNTIIIHFILNSVSTVLSFLLSKIPDLDKFGDPNMVENLMKNDTEVIAILFMGLIVFAEYGCALIGLILFIKKIRTARVPETDYKVSAGTAFFNTGIIVAILVLIFILLLNMGLLDVIVDLIIKAK